VQAKQQHARAHTHEQTHTDVCKLTAGQIDVAQLQKRADGVIGRVDIHLFICRRTCLGEQRQHINQMPRNSYYTIIACEFKLHYLVLHDAADAFKNAHAALFDAFDVVQTRQKCPYTPGIHDFGGGALFAHETHQNLSGKCETMMKANAREKGLRAMRE